MIVGSEPVKRVAIVSKGRSPSVAVVYSTRDGDLEVLDGGKPMRWSDSMFTKYRRRYEVDISDHHLTVRFDEQPLPTQDDIYHFHAEISVAFRVTNPAEVVRRNVTDAAALVRGHLLTACRPITRMYSIQEAEEAEAAVHERFRNDALIYGGITIHAVNARLSLDEAGRAWLQEIQQVDRDEQVKTVKHQSSVRDVNRENEISLLRQGGEHTRQDRERLRLAGRAMDTATMIALHLERNPGDTLGAAKMAAELEEAERAERVRKDEQAQELINGLAAAGHLTHTDVQALLDANLRRLERPANGLARAEVAEGSSTSEVASAPESSGGELTAERGSPQAHSDNDSDAGDDGLRRYLIGEAPTWVRVGGEFSLVARIVVDRPDREVVAVPTRALTVGPDGVDVVLLVWVDSGLAAPEKLQETVRVPYRGGSEPVRFPLRAVREGLSSIRLSAWAGGTLLAELELEISVGSRLVDGRSQRRTTPIDHLHGEPGELTMQVDFDGARYSFQIISRSFVSKPEVAHALTESPGVAVERTVEMLRRFAASGAGYGAASPYSPANAHRWVEETGIGLWRDLVPGPIKDAFWDLRQEIDTFTIACADDRVPWELLYPLSRTEDHGFLAQQFPVIRRVFGQYSSPWFSLRNPQFVVPPRSPGNADAEVARLREILRHPSAGVISRLDELLGLIDSGAAAGMLHFVCHNTFSVENGGSAIAMEGGPFVPEFLGRARTRGSLRGHRPLVFVNACRSAGSAPQYTRMMGWASEFMNAGAGAFVGTLWPVNSDRAAAFAEVFYAELAAGAPLGRAAMRARVETENAGDPTWLAYSVYGDSAAIAA
ncbi:CHAT domain-containing protein [Actinoplanes sp. CA-142083]|uniref:CHAT domain-containing protein n=1 Tax=Actinoplanes sp. CA-142083 TaxID=3239903 RepID=UPI003D923C10